MHLETATRMRCATISSMKITSVGQASGSNRFEAAYIPRSMSGKTTPCTRKPTRTQITPYTRGAQKAHVSASAFAIARFEVEFEEGCRTRAARLARGPRVASAIKGIRFILLGNRLVCVGLSVTLSVSKGDGTQRRAPLHRNLRSRRETPFSARGQTPSIDTSSNFQRRLETGKRRAGVRPCSPSVAPRAGRTTRGAARGAVVGRSARRHGDTLAVRRCGVGQRRRRAPRGGVRPQRARHRQPRRARRVSRAGGVRRRDARGPARHPHLGRRALHHHHDRRARLGVVGPGRHPRAPRLQRRGSVRRRVVLRRRPRRHPSDPIAGPPRARGPPPPPPRWRPSDSAHPSRTTPPRARGTPVSTAARAGASPARARAQARGWRARGESRASGVASTRRRASRRRARRRRPS